MSSICQSCGVPFENNSPPYGTNADGSKNEEFCLFCFSGGTFTEPDIEVKQMIERQVPYLLEVNLGMGPKQAHDTLASFIPSLKRWSK